jgi:hypothetical protein
MAREKLFPFRSTLARSNTATPRQTIKDPPRVVRVVRPTPTVVMDPFLAPAAATDALAPITPATAVDLEGAGGTFITATPANLLHGPQANITDFVVQRLDAGIYGIDDVAPGPGVTTGFLLEDGSGMFILEDASGFLVQE